MRLLAELLLVASAVFAASGCAVMSGQGGAAVPVNKVSAQGFIRDWMVVGGFPNVDVLAAAPAEQPAPGAIRFRRAAPERTSSSGYVTDLLAPVGGESAGTFSPGVSVPYTDAEGTPATAYPTMLSATPAGFVDLAAAFNGAEHTVAYATCKVQADEDMRVNAYFGSDDSAKVWVNGNLVHSIWSSARGAARWSENFPVDLHAGENDVLVKVEQRTGGWGFYLELYRDQDMQWARMARVERVVYQAPSLVLPASSRAVVTGKFECVPAIEDVSLPVSVSFEDVDGRHLSSCNTTTDGTMYLPLPSGTHGYVGMTYSLNRKGRSDERQESTAFYVGDYEADKAVLLVKARAALTRLKAQLADPDPSVQKAARRQVPLARQAEAWLTWKPDVMEGRQFKVFLKMKPAIEAMADGIDYQAAHAGNLPAMIDLPEGMSMPAITFWVSMPEGYGKGGPWPVIIHLHGSGARYAWAPHVANLGEGPLMNYEDGRSMPYICITPATNGGWDPAVLDKLLDHVLDAYNADPDRVSLTGFSMGGFATYRWACERPDRFAALAVLSGGARGNDLSKIAHIPVWIIHGTADGTVPVEGAKEAGAELEKLGDKVRYTFHPGAGHLIQPLTQRDPEFWAWLAGFRREKQGE